MTLQRYKHNYAININKWCTDDSESYTHSWSIQFIIHEKENLSNIEKMLHMSKESILVKDFNLHHFIWEESFYSKQHLLLNELIKMITNINALLALF